MPNFHYRTDERDALFITLYQGDILDAKFLRGFGNPRFVTDKDDINIIEARPSMDSITLDDVDMRVGERFWSRKDGQESHIYFCSMPSF